MNYHFYVAKLSRQMTLTLIWILSAIQLTMSSINPLVSINLKKITSVSVGANALGNTWTAPSVAVCFVRCLSRYPTSCMSVAYQASLHICTPGSEVTAGLPAPPGDLYSRDLSCNSYDGFSVVISDLGIPACLKRLPDQDFHQHVIDCNALGGYLTAPRTIDKLMLVQDFARGGYVGLDDLVSEGDFVWHDNNQLLTEEEEDELFYPGEPNNYGSGEHCVHNGYANKLNDFDCSHIAPGICERPMTAS